MIDYGIDHMTFGVHVDDATNIALATRLALDAVPDAHIARYLTF